MYLVFIQLTVLVLLFTLILESDNNETDEDIHHEECDDDNVNNVVHCHHLSVVMNRAFIFGVGVD